MSQPPLRDPAPREAPPLLLALRKTFPEWSAHLRGVFPVEIPSPSGDRQRALVIWLDEGEPSLAWGSYHTHASCLPGVKARDPASQERAFLRLLQGIVRDRTVLAEEIGDRSHQEGQYWTLLDLDDAESLLEEITAPFASGRIRLRTWSGAGDMEVGPEDLLATAIHD